MASANKKWLKWGVIMVTLLAVLSAAGHWLVVATAAHLVSPPRRGLEDYHLEMLEQPAAYGIRIESHACLNGEVPCLLVTPLASAGSSERGTTIRQQLEDMGHELKPQGEVHGTLVLLHGRRGRKEDLLPVADRFCAAGFRCLLPDLPAHGESTRQNVHYGAGEHEGDLPRLVLDEIMSSTGLPKQPAGIWGMSMGGAFTAKALSMDSKAWDCAVIVSCFDALDEVIRDQSSARAWILGPLYAKALKQTLRKQHGLEATDVRPVSWATQSHVPVMVAHGTVDSLFPLERGRALYEALPVEDKKWVAVEGGDHDNVLVTPMPLYATMAAWYLDHMQLGAAEATIAQ